MATAVAVPIPIPVFRIYELPWSTGEDQERDFKRKLGITMVVTLLLALILSFLPLPAPDPMEIEEIPQRLARLVMEQQPLPPPPPVVREEPEPVPEEVVEAEPEPIVEERVEPEPVAEPVVEPEPVDTVQQARERASVAGLLPFANELAALRDTDLERLGQNDLIDGTVGNGGEGAPGPGAGPLTERSLITSRVGTSSGGINTAGLSRNTGGAGLAGRTTTQVESPVAGIGEGEGEAVRTGESDRASRSREEIERVFDRNKGAIYALYNRALRENPALEGKVVLRLTISPEGVVTSCEIVSSELGDPDLEQKLVQRVLLFQFEAKDVESVTTTKPIDFFPA